MNNDDIEAGKKIFAKDLEVVGEMKRAGVTILAGTDGPYPQGGDALHRELELLVRAGLTPLQALQAASSDAAKAMGVSKDVGAIEVGKIADLVLLDADPLKDISNTRKIYTVLLHGQVFSKNELQKLRGRLHSRLMKLEAPKMSRPEFLLQFLPPSSSRENLSTTAR